MQPNDLCIRVRKATSGLELVDEKFYPCNSQEDALSLSSNWEVRNKMYFLLKRRPSDEAVAIDRVSHYDLSLTLGERLGIQLEEPIRFKIDTEISGVEMPSLFLEAGPLFTRELCQAFMTAGIDNLEVFPAVVSNPDTHQQFDSYVAVNIVGLIGCADLSSSDFEELADSYVIRRLAISSVEANKFLMFRLLEDPMQILVSDKVVSSIPLGQFPDIIFKEVPESLSDVNG